MKTVSLSRALARTGVYGALFAALLFWGSSFVATKIVLQSFAPLDFIFLRFAGASLLFLPIYLRRRARAMELRTHLALLLLALFEPCLYFLFETYGLQYTTASSASIIIAAAPVVVACMARFFLKERLTRTAWGGVVLSIIGVFILAVFARPGADGLNAVLKPTPGGRGLLGNILIFLAVVSASGYMMVARKLSSRLSPLAITFYQIVYGGVFFLPFFLFRVRAIDWAAVRPDAFAALGFLILFSTVSAFLAYNHALSKIDASRTAVFLNGIPVVTVVVARVILKERVGIIHLLGGLLVVAGVVISNMGRGRGNGKKLSGMI